MDSDERGSSADEPLCDLSYPPHDSDSESDSDRKDSVRATLHPVLPGRYRIQHLSPSKLD